MRPLSFALLCLMFATPLLAAPPKKAAEPPAAAAAPAGDAENEGPGTTIFGEQESPIGLYITPWKNANAERGMDRPARFLDEEMLPVDRETFHRQIEYYDTIAAYRRAQLGKKP